MSRPFVSILALAVISAAGATVRAAIVFPSPANDLASSANGGIASSSSTDFGGVASNVIDGDRDGFYGTSVAHTNNTEGTHTMQVAISPTSLGSVVIFNRTDCCSDRLTGGNGFKVEVLSAGSVVYNSGNLTAFSPDISLTEPGGHTASGMTFNFSAVTGDTVRLTQFNPDYMNVAEIEAYAPVPEPGTAAILGLSGAIALFRRRR